MNRRGFLSLLVAAPFVPALAKLQALAAPTSQAVEASLAGVEWSTMVQVLGLSCDLVEPGRVGLMSVYPQRLFRPSRLLVSSVCRDFEILSLSSAGEPVLEEGVSAELFSEAALFAHFEFDVVRPGDQMVLAVVNRGERAQSFNASMIGRPERRPVTI